ncbi:hypothetical protein C0J52_26922 [Blattella germanica]|nr:hypothetical protein C0J52_26922 [Blattella germanica]
MASASGTSRVLRDEELLCYYDALPSDLSDLSDFEDDCDGDAVYNTSAVISDSDSDENDPPAQAASQTKRQRTGIQWHSVQSGIFSWNVLSLQKKDPKAVLRISELNVAFAPQKTGNLNSLQFTFLKDGTTRHIYVYHDDPTVIVNWYMAIRCAKLHRLMVAYPSANESEDAHPKGEIFLGHMLDGYSVRVGVPPGTKDQGFSFTLRTPERSFNLSAATDYDRDEWIQAIDRVIERPLTPQDSSIAARLVRKRTSSSTISIFSAR